MGLRQGAELGLRKGRGLLDSQCSGSKSECWTHTGSQAYGQADGQARQAHGQPGGGATHTDLQVPVNYVMLVNVIDTV